MPTNNDSSDVSEMLVSISRVVNKSEMYYSFKGMCEKLGVSLSTGNRWKKEGKLPCALTINGQARYRDSDIESMVIKQNPDLLGLAPGQNTDSIIKGL
jgi:predicted DNA-binding transcriptional regulator AlpA